MDSSVFVAALSWFSWGFANLDDVGRYGKVLFKSAEPNSNLGIAVHPSFSKH